MKDRLIELLKGAEAKVTEMNSTPLALEEWLGIYADYLLERGVIHLPCKVGDVVYQTDGVNIWESEVCEISLSKKTVIYYNENVVAFDETALGKSIFLTKEDAEQALKGGAENAKVY